jgi:mannose-6-phosphate isomerase
VLRAGLTEKKVDAVEFLDVLDVETSKELQVLEPREILNGLELYPNISEDYCLHRIEVTGENLLADIGLPGDSILVCVAGEIAIGDSLGNREVLRRGEAAYIQNEAKFYSISGSGTGYLGSELS